MKKGFTLIELLAVIVILAIIELIATPIVLNIIKESRENANLRSAEMYLDAVEMSVATSTLNDKKISNGTYNVLESGNICLEYTDDKCTNELKVEVDGQVPSEGSTITVTDGKIENVNLKYNNKTIVKNSKGELLYKITPCKYTTDEDGYEMVTCTIGKNIENFYVMNSYLTDVPSDKIVMMTKYNIDPITYRQSLSAGTVAFSSTEYWSSEKTYPVNVYDERNDIIKPIIDQYITYLNTKLTGATGSLLTYSQAENLGCIGNNGACAPGINGGGNASEWVYSTNYWTGSASTTVSVWIVYSSGVFDCYCYGYVEGCGIGRSGVRPVVTISTSEVE